MVTSVPAWFGRKTRSRKPAGIDVTLITDGSISMDSYVDFITNESLFKSLEQAITGEQIGLSPDTLNRYSFAGGTLFSVRAPEYDVEVDGVNQKWGLGKDFLDDKVVIPEDPAAGEDIADAANVLSSTQRNRGYNPLNQSIFIGGSDEQRAPYIDKNTYKFNQNPAYPYRYIGVHSAFIEVRENPELPVPEWLQESINYNVNGFVYTSDQIGVAIYFNFEQSPIQIKYRDVPVSAMNIEAAFGTLPENILQAQRTNGAIFNIRAFTNQAQFDALGESLGVVLGKLLYELA